MNSADIVKHLFTNDEAEPEALPSFSLNRAGIEHVGKSKIASNLKPLTKGKVGSGSRAFIVGNDGSNISAANYPWLKLLQEWLTAGCNITYLLIGARREAVNRLLKIKSELPKDAGRLMVYTVTNREKWSPEAAEYLKQWETFHFIVFENPAQLWIESCHKPGEIEASGCAYYPPEVAERPGVVDVYKSRFDYIVQNYANLEEA